MAEFLQNNIFILACSAAGLCVFFLTYVVIDFMTYAGNRYKEKYIEETSIEMEDILLQIPPSRILDLSLALAALSSLITVAAVSILSGGQPGLLKVLFLGALAPVIVFPLPRLYLRHLSIQRLAKFNEQLEDALLSMSSSLKAGFSITQAIEVVANDNRRPISFEFTLLIQELRLGVPFDEALLTMSKRVKSQDLELVTMALITARQTGGELTGILERLAGVIRERVRIQQRVRSLTAQGRLQAWMIGAMPFLLMLALAYIAPDMMNAFFGSIVGVLMILGVIIMVVAGFFWIKKITTIDI